jgi:hypothetical protein
MTGVSPLRDTQPTMPEESTTPDLVERTRRAIEMTWAWAAGRDSPSARHMLDAAFSDYGPDSVWDMSSLGMGILTGPEAISGFFAEWLASYEEYEFDLEELNGLSTGVILAVAHIRGRLRDSIGYVELRWATVNEWNENLIARQTTYLDVDEARAAAERLAEERE